jgi:hypothetical protein
MAARYFDGTKSRENLWLPFFTSFFNVDESVYESKGYVMPGGWTV